MREICFGTVLLMLICAGVGAQTAQPTRTTGADYLVPFPAHHVIGNIYFVGSKGLGIYLVATPQGHILMMQVYLGCGWIGAVTVPINTASRGAQLAHILANSQAKLLVLQAEFTAAVDSLDVALPSLRAVWLIGDADLAERWPRPTRFPAPAEPVPEAAIGPGDTVAILYTSGTTGVSKGVCCPHAQYFWWGVNTARLLGLRDDDVLLTSLPLFHTNALNTFYQALLTGAALVVEPRFSASAFAASLSRHGANVTYLLGAMVPILLSRPRAAS